MKVKFSEIRDSVPENTGLYEIHMNMGISLKVGISVNLQDRLLQHRASRQSCLRLKNGGDRNNPNDVTSKGSILAKHLYYDQSLTNEYDLTSEEDRRRFLDEKCYIIFETTKTKRAARTIERKREQAGKFRYVKRVTIR